jgi:hypothetical protein
MASRTRAGQSNADVDERIAFFAQSYFVPLGTAE